MMKKFKCCEVVASISYINIFVKLKSKTFFRYYCCADVKNWISFCLQTASSSKEKKMFFSVALVQYLDT